MMHGRFSSSAESPAILFVNRKETVLIQKIPPHWLYLVKLLFLQILTSWVENAKFTLPANRTLPSYLPDI